ncbi:MAG: DUF2905 domain-containing protein [Armatimonadetes bacterium]|nr:DUF2905 domain-containing protein [Armatimonadota bacterium]
MKEISSFLIILGLLIIIAGVLMRFTSVFHYFGKLPGDIRIVKGNFRFYFPITTMIIISILINLIIRFFKK